MFLTTNPYTLNPRSGFAALLAIVVIGAAALIMAYNASLLGLGELESGYTSQRGAEAFAIADGCMEEALRRLRINPSLSLPTTLNLSFSGGESCTAVISDPAPPGPPTDIVSTGCTVAMPCTGQDAYAKKVHTEVTIDITNEQNAITIGKWEEIP